MRSTFVLVMSLLAFGVLACSDNGDGSSASSGRGFPPPTGKTFDAAPESNSSDSGIRESSDACDCPARTSNVGKLNRPCRTSGGPECDVAPDGTILVCRDLAFEDPSLDDRYCMPPAHALGESCNYDYDCELGVLCDFASRTCGGGADQGAGGAPTGGSNGSSGGFGSGGDPPPPEPDLGVGIIEPDAF